jgi:hypothetical protein
MICDPCKDAYHAFCDNKVGEDGLIRNDEDVRTGCPCQHRNTTKLPDGSIATVREDGVVVGRDVIR